MKPLLISVPLALALIGCAERAGDETVVTLPGSAVGAEAEVLRLLCINKNKILRREIALKMIWGEDDYFMGRSMDVYITKLRKFLSKDPRVSITNIHRTGFMLEVKE